MTSRLQTGAGRRGTMPAEKRWPHRYRGLPASLLLAAIMSGAGAVGPATNADDFAVGGIAIESNNASFTFAYPPSWDGRVDVLRATTLDGGWSLLAEDIYPTGETSTAWQGPAVTPGPVFFLLGDPTTDTDADGLPDSREQLVTGSGPANTDTDGDGLRDGVEANRLGTSPIASNSITAIPEEQVFRILSFQRDDSNRRIIGYPIHRLDFIYSVQRATNVLAWSTLATVTPSTYGVNTWTDSAPAVASAQYRLAVEHGPGFGIKQLVLARNSAGYSVVTLPRGATVPVGLPYEHLDGGAWYSPLVFGDQLPSGTVATGWVPDLNDWRTDTNTGSGWTTHLDFDLHRGFAVTVPTSAPSSSYDLMLLGELPDRYSHPSVSNTIPPGISLLSYPYPKPIAWTNTGLAKLAPVGATQIVWRSEAQSLFTNVKTTLGWTDTNLVMQPGSAFWYISTATTHWAEARPYSWP